MLLRRFSWCCQINISQFWNQLYTIVISLKLSHLCACFYGNPNSCYEQVIRFTELKFSLYAPTGPYLQVLMYYIEICIISSSNSIFRFSAGKLIYCGRSAEIPTLHFSGAFHLLKVVQMSWIFLWGLLSIVSNVCKIFMQFTSFLHGQIGSQSCAHAFISHPVWKGRDICMLCKVYIRES